MYRFLLVILVLVLAVQIQADTLTLKQTFLVGWKYSFDQQHYRSALFSPREFKEKLGTDSVAIQHLKNHGGFQFASIALLAGGVTVAVIEFKRVADEKWTVDDDLKMTIGGGVALTSSFLFEYLSGRQLKKAAARYNSAQQTKATSVSLTPLVTGKFAGVGLTIRF